jgi:hypothetical protein
MNADPPARASHLPHPRASHLPQPRALLVRPFGPSSDARPGPRARAGHLNQTLLSVMGNQHGGLSVPLPSRAALSFLTTKIWRIELDTAYTIRSSPLEPHDIAVVLFRHDAKSGEKRLVVDGHLIHRSTELLDGGDSIQFSVAGKPCRLEVVNFPGLTDYILYYDDIRIYSIMEEREDGAVECPRVRVPEAQVTSAAGPQIVLFTVCSQYRGEELIVQRRFSDFDELDCLVRSVFKGHHLYENLPSLPTKSVKLLTDHLNASFIEERRAKLEAYLRKLCAVPHVVQDPDVLEFLGWGDPRFG